jgi:D-alanyl-lipoteichoic acid acyltransferase DltB (MBOAT superfamily)
MFFPQLVAGPILRAEEVIYQFKNKLNFSINYVEDGIRRILLGLFLKVVLADSISPFVDKGFDINPQFLGAIDVITLAFLFGFQIYFDFSAYSHIAIGTAKLFGLQFPENFNFPYISKSPREFWRRWHISLSSWIRDYLYLPLAGAIFQQSSRGGLAIAIDKKKKNNSLFFTWLLMGLWHGANWNFVFWGFYHYLLIIIYRVLNDNFRNVSIRLKNIVGLPLTLFFSMLSWVFFRADSLQIALQMYSKLLNPQNYFFLGLRENTYIVAFFLLIGTFITYYVHKIVIPYLRQKNVTIAIFETIFMSIVIILVFIYLQTINQFIYFQF